MIQHLLRLFVAGALGALVALELGKYVSDNSVALTIWAVVGGLVGFILVGPKAFFVELKKQIAEALAERKKSKRTKWIRREMRRRRFKNPMFAKIYALRQRDTITFTLGLVFLMTWINGGLSWLMSQAEPKFVLTTIFMGIEIFLLVFIPIMGYFGDCQDQIYLQKDAPRLEKIESELKENFATSKAFLFGGLVGAFWIPISVIAAVLWCIVHIGDLIRIPLIILAKTCRLVATMDRWCTAVGAIVGFIVGWEHGKNEGYTMLFGGVAGNGIYVASKLFLKILPDPDSPWPKFAEANA